MGSEGPAASTDFIHGLVEEDLEEGRFEGPVVTRFPPEPNGFLHIGHAKAICISFGIAKKFGGRTHLRFDDTNPTREEQSYVDAIREDIAWLGMDWGEHEYFASDYFEKLYEWAVVLIRDGLAYVDDQSAEEIRRTRGTLTEPGIDSPYRDRSVAENLDLFARMRAGEFEDGSRVLRARIAMASPNLNLRDPIMYRILRATHQRTGDDWCIYPTYDWAHGQSDSIEGITHSLCDLGFDNHRPLYDWFIEKLGIFPSRQIEFARGNLTHTVTSKRKLRLLVEGGHVSGWDDPRMPTLRGLRRRGYTADAIREFWSRVGVARRETLSEIALLEHCLREELNRTAPRVMAVLRPLKLIVENYPEDAVEEFDAINNPEDLSVGTRRLAFSRELYIEADDFRTEAPRKFFRLAPGREVRLRYAYLVTCTGFDRDDATGEVTAVRCRYDPATRGGDAPDGRRVKGTLHWVSARHAVEADVRLYDHLFSVSNMGPVDGDAELVASLNPESLQILSSAKVEASLADAVPGKRYQFERQGYFCVDSRDGRPGRPTFNRTVPLRDSWARIQRQQGK